MWHAETELYIVDNGGVESALGNVGVESRGNGTVITMGNGAVLQDKFCPKRAFLGVSLQGTEAEAETGPHSSCNSVGTGMGTESKSLILSTDNRANLLKPGYFSGCLTAALASILTRNPP